MTKNEIKCAIELIDDALDDAWDVCESHNAPLWKAVEIAKANLTAIESHLDALLGRVSSSLSEASPQDETDHGGTGLTEGDGVSVSVHADQLPHDLGWEDVDGENAEYVNRVTAVVREADRVFEKAGGSSRHWVRDCFLPLLNRAGLFITPIGTCKHCGEDIRKDADGDWMDRETHTICDTSQALKHQPLIGSGTQPLSEASPDTAQERSAKDHTLTSSPVLADERDPSPPSSAGEKK